MNKFIPFAQPLLDEDEKNEVWDAMSSGWITLGPKTKQFEENFASYIGVKHAIGVTSCTAGLHLSLIVAGIKAGDEVITTPFTFAATANMIFHLGAKPVFADIDPTTFNIDPKQIESKITSKTKAIIPVHYAGYPVDMEAITEIAKKHNLEIIEDAAHAVGTKYKGAMIGSHGNLTNYSFHPIKNMTTGDGGIITTNNDEYAARMSQLRLHGMSTDAWKRHDKAGSWRYDIVEPGFKYNMTDIAAALGIHQLKKLNSFIETRTKYAHQYNEHFKDIAEIEKPPDTKDIEHAWNLYTVRIKTAKLNISRDEIIEKLKAKNIGVSVYFVPLHYFTGYKSLGYNKGDFPHTEHLFEQIISLPLYPKMSKKEVTYVSEVLTDIIDKNKK